MTNETILKLQFFYTSLHIILRASHTKWAFEYSKIIILRRDFLIDCGALGKDLCNDLFFSEKMMCACKQCYTVWLHFLITSN